MACGGYVVDTPGIRQFQLWDLIPEEIAGLCRDVRPYVSLCRFPDCTHTHEDGCAVKDAVADGQLDDAPLRQLLPDHQWAGRVAQRPCLPVVGSGKHSSWR